MTKDYLVRWSQEEIDRLGVILQEEADGLAPLWALLEEDARDVDQLLSDLAFDDLDFSWSDVELTWSDLDLSFDTDGLDLTWSEEDLQLCNAEASRPATTDVASRKIRHAAKPGGK